MLPKRQSLTPNDPFYAIPYRKNSLYNEMKKEKTEILEQLEVKYEKRL